MSGSGSWSDGDSIVKAPPLLIERGVLVIEDSIVQRQALTDRLQQLGIPQVWGAADGAAGLMLLRDPKIQPALVCVDLEMPGMDGIEFLQQLRKLDCEPAVAIVSGANVTVLESVGLMVEALGFVLAGLLPKPYNRERLQRILTRAGDNSGGSKAAHAAAQMSAEQLGRALETGRIVPWYQPKVALKTGEVVGFEALARCIGSDGRALSPAVFIDVAEQSGQMNALTMAMLEQVLADLAGWHAAGLYPTVALNVSASSLANGAFGAELIQRVDAARISPTALTLEVTESALVTDLAEALGALGRLRLRGFGLSLDDFGTGFSSLQQLDRLPFTELKIDRSFVAQVDWKVSRQRILAAAIHTGQQLNLTTVAEGVETLEELAILKRLGCQQVQGYLFARPMAVDRVLPTLQELREPIRAMCRDG